MTFIGGYRLGETIDHAGSSLIAHGVEEGTGRAVIIKTFATEYPHPTDIARLEHEFEIGSELSAEEIIDYRELLPHGTACAIVLEDFGGRSLADVLRERGALDLRQFLVLAQRMARALEVLHDCDIVHRDVTPSNFLYNPHSGVLKLGDLGLASRIPRSQQELVNPERLEGTLAYISPEQTGRMNRAVDYRSDFYSLGATLYELLAGHPPFDEPDPLALIHAHIAKEPEPLHRLNPGIPSAISAIVSRLLAKTAERRYQSARGIQADLAHCARLIDAGAVVTPFELGREDQTSIFRVSQKLYGRDAEVDTMLAAVRRVGKGACELLLVRGYSGIGKSMLVNEVHKPMVAQRGYFITGKYDQLEMTHPLSAIGQCIDDLVRQLLTESEDALGEWRTRIEHAVGGNGRAVTELVPELVHLIGEQPELAPISPTEARARFETTLIAFIQAFANAGHPLVIFLDDLQWVDPASLRVLTQLATHPESHHLLLICAFRDNEVPPSHPFALTLKKLSELGVTMGTVALEPLPLKDLGHFIGDSLGCPPEQVETLAALIERKTGGNPFFVRQFLTSMYDEELLTWERETHSWGWDMERIGTLEVIENVVELMVSKIGRYSSDAQEILSLAACMGNTCDLETLSIISRRTPKEVARALWEPLRDGLVFPIDLTYQFYQWSNLDHAKPPPAVDARYRFGHDRIQEAAYKRIPEAEVAQVNLQIGRLLLERIPEEQREEHLFGLVNHLNLGSALIPAGERLELAVLNLRAARKAKGATAFDAALQYVRHGQELLPADPWQSDYDLTFSLNRERLDCEFLTGNWDEATGYFELTRAHARTRAHIADLFQLMTRILLQANKAWDATDVALDGCRELGLSYPADAHAQTELIKRELETFDAFMVGRDPMDLLDRPVMDDPDMTETLGLLHETWAAAVMAGNFNAVAWSAIKTVTAALDVGNSVFSSAGYIALSQILAINKRYAEADALGRMAVAMAERWGECFVISKVNNTYCNFTSHFVHHTRTCIAIYERSYECALVSGDSWWGSWAAGWLRCARLICGFPLAQVQEIQSKFHGYIRSSAYKPLELYSLMDRQIVRNLLGETLTPYTFSSEDYDEQHYLEYFEETRFGFGLHLHYLYKAMTHWLYGRHEETPSLMEQADRHRDHIPMLMPWQDHFFYGALCAAEHANAADAERAAAARERMREGLERLRHWNASCPSNFAHRVALVAAEFARVDGHDAEALALYQQAIDQAQANEYIQHEAMANELAARHHLALGRKQAATGHLMEAHLLYARWGAETKVAMLLDEFPRILGRRGAALDVLRTIHGESITSANSTVTATAHTIELESVDLMTVLKASQAISGELVLGRLMERLMQITMEHAGAQRGVFLLEREGGLTTVEAIADIDETSLRHEASIPLDESEQLPRSVVRYVQRTGRTVALDDAENSDSFSADPYIREHRVKSLLCVPAVSQGRRLAVLYVENARATGAFPPEHVSTLKLLCSQAAVALENAILYDSLEQKVRDRTRQLEEQNRLLEQQNLEILRTQVQLVQSEKMASLGRLAAGVAHEINNPITFIASGLPSIRRSVYRLADMVAADAQDQRYRKTRDRLERLIDAAQEGAARTTKIVQDFRSFACLDESPLKRVELNAALDSTLLVLGFGTSEKIEIVRDYGEIPPVQCYVSEINQVFMILLINAADAIGERGAIRLRTAMASDEQVMVSIGDTGCGMTPEVLARIFDPFFTTKDVGQGTGLGLSTAHGIIQRHGGRIEVHSEPGVGSEFRIGIPVVLPS